MLKTAFTVVLAGLSSYFGMLTQPLLVLFFAMVLDYLTGMTKAYIFSQLSSRIGVKGILKKLCYMAMVAVGAAVDYLLHGALKQAGIDLQTTFDATRCGFAGGPLYDNKVQRLISSGMSEEEAKTEAAKAVAIPGTSEHQLGLAVDLVDANMQDLTSAQESTETQKWLMANSWRYGFIHRYPNGKTDITGIIYEPWHYRYVGKDAAQEIFNRDITLEEYLGKTEH